MTIFGGISNLPSQCFYDDEEFKSADKIITNGYDKGSDRLGHELDIRPNARVSSTDYTNTEVTANGEFIESDWVVVSVPLGMLKNNTLSFCLQLPSNRALYFY